MNQADRTHRSRRASLAALSLAGLTAMASSVSAGARKKSNDKKARKRCRSQIGQCQALVNELNPDCGENPDCQELLACCEIAGRCQFAGFMECTVAAIS
jgi:hypothetical protein